MRRHWAAAVFAVLLFLLAVLLPLSVAAEGEQTGSVNIVFVHNKVPVVGAVFRLYRVAEQDEAGEYGLTEAFSSFPITIEDLRDSDSWNAAANTFAAYVTQERISPDAEGETDLYGMLCLHELPLGMYLVVGDVLTTENGTVYQPSPFLIPIPTVSEDGGLLYEITAEPKFELYHEDDKLERRALKVWENEANAELRPHSITVQLLCDGKLYDEQELNAENNWRYSWTDLDAKCQWRVIEKEVPADYKVSIDRQGLTYVITNTYTPTESTNPPSSEPPPQTGLLWWPVPVLLVAGVVLIAVGALLFRHRNGNHA